MPTDTKLNQLIINQLTQEQYDEAKAAGTLSDTELYITDSDDDAQVKSNLSQTIDDSTTKYPSNKAVKDESSRITTLMNTKVSNCITEIPQDIKLELNNGTLKLKAGSKVYVPNGPGVFDVVTIANDINYRYAYSPSSDSFVMLFINQSGTAFVNSRIENSCFSGETQPSGNYINWYKTNENRMYSIGNNATIDNSGFSFPIARIIQGSDGVTKSIEQVFNGFGYIGSTVFALPGVKGLIPNGRNADGTLKSIEFTLNKVISQTHTSGTYVRKLILASNNIGGYTNLKFDELSNYNIDNGMQKILCDAGTYITDNGKITSFIPKTVFHALDYNDKSTISGWGMPSSRYIDLSFGASGSTYTAPANGYFYLVKVSGNDKGDIRFSNKTKDIVKEVTPKTSTNWLYLLMEAQKGDVFEIAYGATGDTKKFRFIYAEGQSYNPVSSSSGGIAGGVESGGMTDWGDGTETNPY